MPCPLKALLFLDTMNLEQQKHEMNHTAIRHNQGGKYTVDVMTQSVFFFFQDTL